MIIKTALASAAILCAMAAPGFCATSFDFTGTGGTFNASSNTLSAASVDFTTLTVSGDPNSNLNGTYSITANGSTGTGTLTLSGGYLILTGDVSGTETGFANITTPTTLFEIAVGNTTTSTGGSPYIAFNTTPLDLSFGSTLLSHLGIAAPVAGTCVSAPNCDIQGTYVSGTTYNATSNTVDANLIATPEPVSFLMMGGGLLFVGGLARRKRKA